MRVGKAQVCDVVEKCSNQGWTRGKTQGTLAKERNRVWVLRKLEQGCL